MPGTVLSLFDSEIEPKLETEALALPETASNEVFQCNNDIEELLRDIQLDVAFSSDANISSIHPPSGCC